MRKIIRADGTNEDLPGPKPMTSLKALIGADTIDTVSLRHMGTPLHVMLVDDNGHGKKLPVNAEATNLYHANCVPGTTHAILGDVAVVPDDDFA
jgi:hypothetical protein